ncbi:UNVERIFIED_CONTAM: hypothetical protein RF653_06750 [Kocuria sp. CPCC 205316]|uniref:hypothetical protein n=1 Tax=Kocuria TaxID=57493 RepID=UPI0036DF3CB2
MRGLEGRTSLAPGAGGGIEPALSARPQEVAALMAFLDSDEAPSSCGSIVESTGAQAVA